MHPGIITYRPWRAQGKPQGPWSAEWPHAHAYPAIENWPGNERWWDNPNSPLNGEFTVHQNIGPAAAIFAFFCAEAKRGHG